MSDGQRALAALAFERGALVLFGLLLQQPLSRNVRCSAGIVFATLLLVIEPFIYHTPTQVHSVTCASFGCMAAFAMLHWALLGDSQQKHTVLEIMLSPIRQCLEGVIKVHQRFMRLKGAPGSSKPARRVALQQPCQPGSTSLWVLLQQALLTSLVCATTYDLGLFLLCSISNGMCSSSYSIPTRLGLAGAGQSGQVPYLVRCAFAFPAGILLTQQIEFIYGIVRILMILLAFKWPALGQLAAQTPDRAFNWPVAAASVSELWGFRWHQFLRFWFEGLAYAAANAVLPKGKAPAALQASLRCLAVFALSGLLHEYISWAVFGVLTGWHMAFFMLNAVAVLLENCVPALLSAYLPQIAARLWAVTPCESETCTVTAPVTPLKAGGDANASKAYVKPSSDTTGTCTGTGTLNGYKSSGRLPAWLGHVWTLSFFILLSPLFVEPYRTAGIFAERAFLPLGTPLVPALLGWIQQAN